MSLRATARGFAALPLALVACTSPEWGPGEPERFAGPASSEAYAVGVVADADGGVLYVCGTTDASRPRSEWLDIDAEGRLTTRGTTTERGRADVSDSGVSGTVSLVDGSEVSFSVPLVTDLELGLFSAVDSGCRSGVVAYPGGSAGTWCSSDGRFEQVTPIQPIDGGALLVQIASQLRRLRVDAVDAATFR